MNVGDFWTDMIQTLIILPIIAKILEVGLPGGGLVPLDLIGQFKYPFQISKK